MHLRIGFLLLLGAALLPGFLPLTYQTPPAAQDKASRVDSYGDPLPAHAVARLGTNRLRSHGYAKAVLSPDGKYLLSGASTTSCVPLSSSTATGQVVKSTYEETVAEIQSVCFDPQGINYAIVFLAPKSTLRVYGVESGKVVASISRELGVTYAVAFSRNAKVLAFGIGVQNKEEDFIGVRIWDLARGAKLHDLKEHEGIVKALAFSPDGKTIASADTTGVMKLWEVSSGRLLKTFAHKHVGAPILAFSQDGNWLVSAGRDGCLYLWDPTKDTAVHVLAEKSDNGYFAVTMCPDGKTILAGTVTGKVETWDLQTKKLDKSITLIKQPDLVASFAISPACDLVATGTRRDPTINVWNSSTGKKIASFAHSNQYQVDRLAFSPDSRMLLSGANSLVPDSKAQVILWDLSGMKGK